MTGGQRDLHIAADLATLAQRAAEAVATEVHECVAARGRCALALAGGSTPRPLYRLLAAPPFAHQMPWNQLHVFWGDERCVSQDHSDSNMRMASEALLAHVPLPPANVHRVPVELEGPDAVAAAYEAELRTFFGAADTPALDLVLLGMGADGHTASLFPGSEALAEARRLVVAAYAAHLRSWRVTFTLPTLNVARAVMFIVAGADKAPAVRAVLAGGRELPAAQVRPASGRLSWFVDAAAAAGVDSAPG